LALANASTLFLDHLSSIFSVL